MMTIEQRFQPSFTILMYTWIGFLQLNDQQFDLNVKINSYSLFY